MKATITINRHVVADNKRNNCDNPAISIKTYLGVIYAKHVSFTGITELIQDAENARCNGATIWMEAQLEECVIDGVPGNREMYSKSTTPASIV